MNDKIKEKLKMEIAISQIKNEEKKAMNKKEKIVFNYPQYRTVENRARKVWVVNIHYKQGEPDPNNEKKYNSKSIFVDCTTGEVVGGADESYWDETTAKKRKYYAITEKGKKQLKEKKEEWKLFSNGINHVLGGVSFAN